FVAVQTREQRLDNDAALDVVHKEERGSDYIRVFAQKMRVRHRYAAVRQCADDPILALDLVRGLQKGAIGFLAHHETPLRRLKQKGGIRLADQELRDHQRTAKSAHPIAQVARKSGLIEAMVLANRGGLSFNR